MTEFYGPIEGQFKVKYQQNVMLALQQKDSRLEKAVMELPTIAGFATQVVDLVGTSEVLEDQPDDTPTPHIPPSNEGIWVTPRHRSWGRLIKQSDNIRTATDYESSYVQEAASAFRRAKDKIIAASFFGPRLISFDDGTGTYVPGTYTSQVYGGNTVAVDDGYFGPPGTAYTPGTPKNMNPIKIAHALGQLIGAEADIDNEEVFIGMTYKQHTMMYDGIQATSTDYTGRNNVSFSKKRLERFLDSQVIIYNSLPLDGSGYRRCPLWLKSGMAFGEAMPLTTTVDRRPDRQFRIQMFGEAWWAATRTQDNLVVEIKCLDTFTDT